MLIRRIPSTDPRLGRHVRHDPRSRAYPFPTAGLTLRSVRHARRIPVLDQGQLGSCTGNAGIGALGTEPFYGSVLLDISDWPGFQDLAPGAPKRYALNEAGAVQLYSDATKLDDASGQYPPDDTGSDGLSVAKALKKADQISGYQHTFTLQDALLALTVTPVMTGVTWFEGMFTADPDGRLHPTGAVAGGHEFVLDELDVENKRIWMTNSWGDSWGIAGRAYLTWDDYGKLLADEGDVTVFVPLTQPAPVPTPPADVDDAFAAALRHNDWITRPHVGDNHKVAVAARAWLTARGL